MAETPKSGNTEGLAARWSRRKQEARAQQEPSHQATLEDTPDAMPMQEDEISDPSDPDEIIQALPPIESLNADSDFTPFLDRAVPAELRRMALRKLWLSDPVFANLDGLNDYDDDFRTLGVGKLVRTAYEVGKGMVTRAESNGDQADDEVPATDIEQATSKAVEVSGSEGDDEVLDDEEPSAEA